VSDLQQALKRIGRDDIVQKMNKHDVDGSEGDSLRLASSKFSSKGSLGGIASASHPQASEPIRRVSPPSTPPRAAQASAMVSEQMQEEHPVQTVVTRIERYIHHSEHSPEASGPAEPVVDERTVTRIYRDDAPMQETVQEKRTVEPSEGEQHLWHEGGDASPEEKAALANSKQTMVFEEEERFDDGDVLKTTTLVTQQVLPPSDMELDQFQNVQSKQEPLVQLSPDTAEEESTRLEEAVVSEPESTSLKRESPVSADSVIVHDEEVESAKGPSPAQAEHSEREMREGRPSPSPFSE
jgi:hypothetical protein